MGWLGRWLGQWLGTRPPAPAGALAGTAPLRLGATGALSRPPVVVWARGTARLSVHAQGQISAPVAVLPPLPTSPLASGGGRWRAPFTKPRPPKDDEAFLLAVLL
jgi:hypothetical protein